MKASPRPIEPEAGTLFFRCDKDQWREIAQTLTFSEVKVYFDLLAQSPFGQTVTSTVTEMATGLGINKATVSDALKRLSVLGYITLQINSFTADSHNGSRKRKNVVGIQKADLPEGGSDLGEKLSPHNSTAPSSKDGSLPQDKLEASRGTDKKLSPHNLPTHSKGFLPTHPRSTPPVEADKAGSGVVPTQQKEGGKLCTDNFCSLQPAPSKAFKVSQILIQDLDLKPNTEDPYKPLGLDQGFKLNTNSGFLNPESYLNPVSRLPNMTPNPDPLNLSEQAYSQSATEHPPITAYKPSNPPSGVKIPGTPATPLKPQNHPGSENVLGIRGSDNPDQLQTNPSPGEDLLQALDPDIAAGAAAGSSKKVDGKKAKGSEAVDPKFELFWAVYHAKGKPKQEKKAAYAHWKKVKVDKDFLIESARRFIDYRVWKDTLTPTSTDWQYVPFARTWLSGEKWEDEIPTFPGDPGVFVKPEEGGADAGVIAPTDPMMAMRIQLVERYRAEMAKFGEVSDHVRRSLPDGATEEQLERFVRYGVVA